MSFISNAYAATTNAATTTATTATGTAATATAQHPAPMMNTVIMVAAFALFIYFLLWRPQAKRAKEHRDLLGSLKQDDEVLTNGGIMGKVVEIENNIIQLKIAENTIIKIQKGAVAAVLPKGTIK